MENDELLHKWVNGELTEEELEVFKNQKSTVHSNQGAHNSQVCREKTTQVVTIW